MTLELYIRVQGILQSNGYQDESEQLALLYPVLHRKWEEITEQAYNDYCYDAVECSDIYRKK